MHPIPIKEKAERLRREGYTYTYISKKLKLSKSTLSDWLTDMPYSPNQEMYEVQGKARTMAGVRRADMRRTEMIELREEAEIEIQDVTKRDLFMFGLGIYLGEGSKTNRAVNVVNSDPQVMQSMIAWFKMLGVKIEQFAPVIFAYPDNDMDACLQFWSETTTIPKSQFRKSQIDLRTDKKRKAFKKLTYGTLHLNVQSQGNKEFGVKFFRKIKVWMEMVPEKIQKAGLV